MRNIISIFVFALFFGCKVSAPVTHRPSSIDSTQKKIAVFLDGTANNEKSHTNVSKLYHLTSLQENPNINAFYSPGVGNKGNIFGMLAGQGMKQVVCNAYLFIAEDYNHNSNDKIYLFGFSRGAYASRILAGFIYIAGIIDVQEIPKEDRLKLIKKMYDAAKSKENIVKRRQKVRSISKQNINPDDYRIEFMGIWDTVAAMGLPDFKENFRKLNNGYIDQLCNINKVAHALSLNDTRAKIITPSLITEEYLIQYCEDVEIENIADEVWFFGAHSDVGGGYRDSHLSGVSLNWMIEKVKALGLVKESTRVYEDNLGIAHNPRESFFGSLYSKKERSISSYALIKEYKNEKIKVHRSVIKRLKFPTESFNINLVKNYKHCFKESKQNGYEYIGGEKCFEVVD